MSAEREPAAEPSVREARLEAALESVSDVFYALDSDWRCVVFNAAAEQYFGVRRDSLMGKTLWEMFPQGRGTQFERYCQAAMDEGATNTLEVPSVMRAGRFVELRISPMHGGGVAVSLNDITERRRAEDALKAALARSEMILESISDAFYAVDEAFRFTYVNSVAESWWGRPRESLLGKVIWQEFPQSVATEVHDAHLKAAREHSVVRAELVSPVHDRWIDVSIFPTETGLSVYFRDITARKLAEERQQLLVNELNHRVKNALATVQAIAAQSLQGDDPPAEARERFTDRLTALARANDVLVRQNWQGAELAEVAALVASPHAEAGDAARFRIGGPRIGLSPNATTALVLALHELATNAAKYGALSRPEGRVELTWAVTDAGHGGRQRLRLCWRESGGPPVRPPTRRGFGTRLISRGLASELKAEVRLDYAPGGLEVSLDAPLGDGVRLMRPHALATCDG